jgi:hypothetical protein
VLPFVCPDRTLDCWDKFHSFYSTQGLFSATGFVNRKSKLYKMRRNGEAPQVKTSKRARTLEL